MTSRSDGDDRVVDMYKFIKKTSHLHLTLEDVYNLKPGDELDVVIWDRNWEENWVWGEANHNEVYSPEDFFLVNRRKVIYRGNMKWDIKFGHGTELMNIHVNTENLPSGKTKWTWLILDDGGEIHVTEELDWENGTLNQLEEEEQLHFHHTHFDPTTRVGWRGPIMKWEHVVNSSKYIRYLEDEE